MEKIQQLEMRWNFSNNEQHKYKYKYKYKIEDRVGWDDPGAEDEVEPFLTILPTQTHPH